MEYNKQTIDAIAKLNNTSPDIVDKQLCIGAEMTNEFFKNKEINNIADLPQEAFGFIYQTTHTPTDKKYIGKKSLMYNLKKKLGKKEKALWEGKGRPPMYKRVLKESDWKTYYGSHHLIKEYLKGGFEHELKL